MQSFRGDREMWAACFAHAEQDQLSVVVRKVLWDKSNVEHKLFAVCYFVNRASFHEHARLTPTFPTQGKLLEA